MHEKVFFVQPRGVPGFVCLDYRRVIINLMYRGFGLPEQLVHFADHAAVLCKNAQNQKDYEKLHRAVALALCFHFYVFF